MHKKKKGEAEVAEAEERGEALIVVFVCFQQYVPCRQHYLTCLRSFRGCICINVHLILDLIFIFSCLLSSYLLTLTHSLTPFTFSFRSRMTAAGFDLRGDATHPICPVMLGDARLAQVD